MVALQAGGPPRSRVLASALHSPRILRAEYADAVNAEYAAAAFVHHLLAHLRRKELRQQMREQEKQRCCPTHRAVGTMGRQEMILVEKEEYLVEGLFCGNVNNELAPLLPPLRATATFLSILRPLSLFKREKKIFAPNHKENLENKRKQFKKIK
jgi:hypothetical protein